MPLADYRLTAQHQDDTLTFHIAFQPKSRRWRLLKGKHTHPAIFTDRTSAIGYAEFRYLLGQLAKGHIARPRHQLRRNGRIAHRRSCRSPSCEHPLAVGIRFEGSNPLDRLAVTPSRQRSAK